MLQQRAVISIGEAMKRIMNDECSQPVEMVGLMESIDRFLAEDIFATHPIPAFDKSLYDGYAIRAEDTIGASKESPVVFDVIGKIGAGSIFSEEVRPFQAVRIMTGAEIPATCNAVVMLEDVKEYTKDGLHKIKISQQLSKGHHVFAKGSEIKEGSCIAKKGTQITPGIIGLLATFGIHQIKVTKKPVIGVIATGSELLELNQTLERGKIYNSNAYMLLAQVEKAGGEPIYLGKLEDDLPKSVEVIKQSLEKVDILLTTGGVSVGDYDYLPAVYKELGAEVLFNKIAMRPGSVTTVAKLGEKYLFGLSGNPSASFIGFEFFVRPLIQKRLGNRKPYLPVTRGVLCNDFPKPNNFTQIIRTTCTLFKGQLLVASNGLNMSGAVSSIAGAEGLAILPPTTTGYKCGDIVDVMMLSLQKGQSQSSFGGDFNGT